MNPSMRFRRRVLASLLLVVGPSTLNAEILVRWDQDQVPSREALGISTLVVAATNRAAMERAFAAGYRVYAEVQASTVAKATIPAEGLAGIVVRGAASAAQLASLQQQLKSSPGARVIALDERGKWPHIRTNWVTRNNDVLQVTRSSAQPWIENNAALVRMERAREPRLAPMLTYPWKPVTLSEIDEGPATENYLLAIAEAGSFGGDLLLPLHERFQRNLLLGRPQARLAWNEIRRHIEFYAWNLPARHEPIANIGVLADAAAQSFEVLNLLLRHNLPFELLRPAGLPSRDLAPFRLLIALDPPDDSQTKKLAAFARMGGTVVVAGASANPQAPWRGAAPVLTTDERVSYRFGEGHVVEAPKGIANPDTFALEVRQLLGREHRVIDIWNGITVLTAPYLDPDGKSVLVTAVNYAHQPLPVQMRVRGTFAVVHYESPDEPLTLLPYQHRDGGTEFVLPALRIGGRVFLSERRD